MTALSVENSARPVENNSRRSASKLASGRVSRKSQTRRGSTYRKPSIFVTLIMIVMVLYAIVPMFWLVVNATKTKDSLYTSFAMWFSSDFNLFGNIKDVLTYGDGIFIRWFLNTLLYVVAGAGGATLLAALAGYGLAKYKFPGRSAVFAVVIGAMAIPGTVLAVPQFLLFSKMGLANTPYSVIIPSLTSVFGMYLVWVYAREAIPDELLEAARLDGANELRIFFSISLKQLGPALITVLMFAVVATWNNYFLPLIMLSDPQWYPLTVGLNQWASASSSVGVEPIPQLVITGSLLTVLPITAVFLYLQRYWQSGLVTGSVK